MAGLARQLADGLSRGGTRAPQSQLPANRAAAVQSPASPAATPAPTPAAAPAASGSALTQKLEEARRNGTLGSMVGHSEAAAWGDKPFEGDFNSLAQTFGHGDLEAMMGNGGGQPAPVAPAPPGAPAPTTPAPAPGAAPAPGGAQLGPPVIPPPAPMGAGWQSTTAPGSLAGNIGGRTPSGPFGALTEAMSRRGRMY